MTYCASYSKAPDLTIALDEICDELARGRGLNGIPPDISFLFVSHFHADRFEELASLAYRKSQTRLMLGCTGETIAGGGEEIESGPAISMWSAVLPDAEIELFHAEFSQTPDGIVCDGLPSGLAEERADVRAVFVFGEPFSADPRSLIDRLADELPGVPVIGGMASGAAGPGINRLFLNSTAVANGAVGAVVRGGPRIRSVVSQGCRPIGKHYVVTRAEQNIVRELGGVPPMQRLQELLPTLSDQDQQLIHSGLHLGIVMNEYQETFARGDFLIANVIGAREDDGSLAIGNNVRVGQTVQFHVRDAVTADEDLVRLLEQDRTTNSNPPQGALLFSCNGRGTRLFPEPNHDTGTIQEKIGPIPLAGFFAQGELGPVGGRNYVHGFTASVALFE
ncbi:MAG: FIST C-terminal domain-containing protein [Gemmatimonadetes bacterium]|nr:FIST C-terminal domain-containing protein [Gemmatimonadota bacterium]